MVVHTFDMVGYKTAPAMASGLTDRIRDIRRLTDLVLEHRPKPGKVRSYKLRAKSPISK